MDSVSKKSASADQRRLPFPCHKVDVNFCRNPKCQLFGDPPDPFIRRGRPATATRSNFPRGKVSGSDAEKTFVCGACGSSSVLKNNRAIVEEYRRRRRRQLPRITPHRCPGPVCENRLRPVVSHPELYQRFGKTPSGDQRYRCKACGKTLSIGKPARRQHLASRNGLVLRLLVHGTAISKISQIADLNARDVYAKIDFISERARDFVAEREAAFEDVDWERRGRRFATDSQTLTLNWPSKRTRAAVAVQHLCTAHANSGYIVAGHLQFDPEPDMEQVEIDMMLNGDLARPRCFREIGRLWSRSEFADYVEKITRDVPLHPEEAPEVEPGLQTPHDGALVRLDIQQFAHALTVRKALHKTGRRFFFVLDRDPGLAGAFLSAFMPEVKSGMADVAVVAFDKHQINDARNRLVAEGRKQLAQDSGHSIAALDALDANELDEITDAQIEERLESHPLWAPYLWPYHTKSEPARMVEILTDGPAMPPARRARLMRLATLRSVDAYFHKVRSNVRPAMRAGTTPSSNGKTWDRYYLYNPEMLAKIMEIYRFSHNWMGARETKATPAMKLGLARGKIYERDLFG